MSVKCALNSISLEYRPFDAESIHVIRLVSGLRSGVHQVEPTEGPPLRCAGFADLLPIVGDVSAVFEVDTEPCLRVRVVLAFVWPLTSRAVLEIERGDSILIESVANPKTDGLDRLGLSFSTWYQTACLSVIIQGFA
jgi:hypothetical protein